VDVLAGEIRFAEKDWTTGLERDWPNDVRSVVMTTSADNSGIAVCAWNLAPGGIGRDMSQVFTTEAFTPILTLAR
jgi:hypothetical protein